MSCPVSSNERNEPQSLMSTYFCVGCACAPLPSAHYPLKLTNKQAPIQMIEQSQAGASQRWRGLCMCSHEYNWMRMYKAAAVSCTLLWTLTSFIYTGGIRLLVATCVLVVMALTAFKFSSSEPSPTYLRESSRALSALRASTVSQGMQADA
jgi:hypothetical protein